MNKQSVPLTIRIYFFTKYRFEKALSLTRACFIGLWLGVLTRDKLHAVDKEYWTRSKSNKEYDYDEYNYYSEEWNRRGLFSWEKSIIDRYYAHCKRLLVLGAGGGREVYALQQLGYDVDGFECHPDLVLVANKLLHSKGYAPTVQLVPRDECPDTEEIYDGIIVGWSAYMLVQGRRRRIALLQQLRTRTRAQCPILLSFFYRTSNPRSLRTGVFVANTIRRVLRREPAEIGDWLTPEYVHYFTQEEITSELSEGGFIMTHYSTTEYGHAVGIAV